MCSSIATLTVAFHYYVFRPKDHAEFRTWWRRGRWILLYLILLLFLASLSLLVLTCGLVAAQWLLAYPSEWCDVLAGTGGATSRFNTTMVLGLGGVIFSYWLGWLLMF